VRGRFVWNLLAIQHSTCNKLHVTIYGCVFGRGIEAIVGSSLNFVLVNLHLCVSDFPISLVVTLTDRHCAWRTPYLRLGFFVLAFIGRGV
jgi:hypothetical protein